MTKRLACGVLLIAALCAACGESAARIEASEHSDTTMPYPPITFPPTTVAPPVGDGMTLALNADTGFVPYMLVRQDISFSTTLTPGVTLRNADGMLVRAWIATRDGSEQLDKGFDFRGDSGAQAANVEISDSQYVSVLISGDPATTAKIAAKVPLQAIREIGDGGLDALSKAFGPGWTEVARLEQGAKPLGESWSIGYTTEAGGGLMTVVYSLTEPGGLELAGLILINEFSTVGSTPVIFQAKGAGMPAVISFMYDPSTVVVMSAEEKPDVLEHLIQSFVPTSLKDLQAALPTDVQG